MWASPCVKLLQQSQQGKKTIESASKMEVTFCSLIVEVATHYHYCILLIRQKPLCLALTQWETVTLRHEYKDTGIIGASLICLPQGGWGQIDWDWKRAMYLPWVVVSGHRPSFCGETLFRLKLKELFSPRRIQGNLRGVAFSPMWQYVTLGGSKAYALLFYM